MAGGPGDHHAGSEGPSLSELIHRADPAELLAEVERACTRRDWPHLETLRARCQQAAEELGKQLWPVAQYAEYRLALEAPAAEAAAVLRPGAAKFALGPLTEVVAQHHDWASLADHLQAPYIAATVAQERVVRGEDLRGDERAHPGEYELPLVLQRWEPDYPLPVYRPDELLENSPELPRAAPEPVRADPGRPDEHAALERALEDTVDAWVRESNGMVHVATVRGDAAAAVAASIPGPARVRRLAVPEAAARLAWAGASGGAYGRRRGLAAGRAAMLWVAHAAAGLAFPAEPGPLGAALDELRWYQFDEGGDEGGWRLRLVVDDPAWDRATLIDAVDARREEDADDRA